MHYDNPPGGRYYYELEACYDKLRVTGQVPELQDAARRLLIADQKKYALEAVFEGMTLWLASLSSPSQHVEYNGMEIAQEVRGHLLRAVQNVSQKHASGHGHGGGSGGHSRF